MRHSYTFFHRALSVVEDALLWNPLCIRAGWVAASGDNDKGAKSAGTAIPSPWC